LQLLPGHKNMTKPS